VNFVAQRRNLYRSWRAKLWRYLEHGWRGSSEFTRV